MTLTRTQELPGAGFIKPPKLVRFIDNIFVYFHKANFIRFKYETNTNLRERTLS